LSDTFGNEKLVRSQSVVARVVAGETLIVPIRGKVGDLASIYSFNGTGTLIWKQLESPKTVVQLAVAVAKEYDVDPSQAERDVAPDKPRRDGCSECVRRERHGAGRGYRQSQVEYR
jgi:hypothetical protein